MTHAMQQIAPDDWLCPTCGRRFVLRLVPFHKIVIVPGDTNALHTGSTGELAISNVDVDQDDPLWAARVEDALR